MTTDRELMQQALDALEYVIQSVGGNAPESFDVWFQKTQVPAEALRARLAQPEPLPAKSKGALSHEENKRHNKMILDKFYEENAHFYTAPPQREWQGLTVEEIEAAGKESRKSNLLLPYSFARAIEAKLKEKNNG